MSVRIRIAGVALLSLCFACGGGGSSGPSLTISPATLTVTSGSTPAGFTATLTGSSDAIAWSLSGPGSISTTSGTSTSYTPPASLAASTTAILTATAGTLTASATITINPPAINLTVSPQTLTVAAGTAATTFTATLTGSSNAIAWSLSGPGSISTMAGTTTSYTPPISVTSTTTATLTATAGASLTASATITINVPAPITVSGTLVNMNNLPMAGASVSIGAQNTLSASNGTFTIANVTPPYDLIAISNKIGVVYQQLTLTNPTVVFFSVPSLPNSGTVKGSVSPATGLGVTGMVTTAAWGSPETSISANYDFNFSANPFSITPSWFGPASTTGNVHVIQEVVSSSTNFPTSYPGYGMAQGVVLTSAGVTTPTINLVSISVGSISGTLTLPTASYTIPISLLNAEFSDGATALLGSSGTVAAGSFTFATPLGIDATMDIEALAEEPGTNSLSATMISGVAPTATGVQLSILAPSDPGLPSDSATGITTTTEFTWTPFAGGINFITFVPTNSANPTYYVVTSATSITIPNLSTQGLGLPTGGQAYRWQVYGFAPFANVNAFASKNFFAPLASAALGIIVIQPPSNFPVYSYSLADNRAFTTQ
jgi:hypothetical protein